MVLHLVTACVWGKIGTAKQFDLKMNLRKKNSYVIHFPFMYNYSIVENAMLSQQRKKPTNYSAM